MEAIDANAAALLVSLECEGIRESEKTARQEIRDTLSAVRAEGDYRMSEITADFADGCMDADEIF
jgi:hypothetical protein